MMSSPSNSPYRLVSMVALALFWGLGPVAAFARQESPAGAAQSDAGQPPSSAQELEEMLNQLISERSALQQEVAKAQLDLSAALRKITELEQFIKDHDQYGVDFEKYLFYRERIEKEERAKRAAEARAKREEAERKAREAREQKKAQRDVGKARDADLQARVDAIEKAGFTIVGDAVGIGQLTTFYQTTSKEEIQYIPSIDFWYVDRDKVVDYTHLRISGSIIQAERDTRDMSVAVVFYNRRGGQIGQTTVRIDGARPGVPYPFTANIDMADNAPFATFTSYVMYFEPSLPNTPDPLLAPPTYPATQPAPAPAQTPENTDPSIPETTPESDPAAPPEADPEPAPAEDPAAPDPDDDTDGP